MLPLRRRSHRPLPLKASSTALRHAARFGSVDVLEWWFRVGLIRCDKDLAATATLRSLLERQFWAYRKLPGKH
ncbi:hypothetical protein BCR44DRAFT_81820 [Catenaria anguillulae PL171]|uniref:Uncharacterized protein n=1 Tax=Catenaria anguillulae PL171 TaxID=765915 RepID=A0A1Y2HEX3_9FUNG|nr:hypothetical protein BCR44DRAFT_81820 [Catenaria anguillulae PL171]